MKKLKPLVLVIGILFTQVFLSTFLGALAVYGAGHKKAPDGLQIWGVNLSGMTKDEAFEIIKKKVTNSLIYENKIYTLELEKSYQELAAYLDNQYSVATGNILTDVLTHLSKISQPIEEPSKYNEAEVRSQLVALAQEIDRPGKAAEIYFHEGEIHLVEGSIGKKVDIEKTWQGLNQEDRGEAVPLVVEDILVHPTNEELAQVQDVLGDYTTYFNPNNKERTNNVILAAEAIDGTLIPPNGKFSFNQVVGERLPERGYLPALVFQDNRVVVDDGGGICQDSSTLYNAVKQANLEVVERHSHTLPVTYIPSGKDATVAYGILDFQFRNDTQGYILLSAKTGKDWLRIRIFGVADEDHPKLKEPDGYPVKLEDWIKNPK